MRGPSGDHAAPSRGPSWTACGLLAGLRAPGRSRSGPPGPPARPRARLPAWRGMRRAALLRLSCVPDGRAGPRRARAVSHVRPGPVGPSTQTCRPAPARAVRVPDGRSGCATAADPDPCRPSAGWPRASPRFARPTTSSESPGPQPNRGLDRWSAVVVPTGAQAIRGRGRRRAAIVGCVAIHEQHIESTKS